ncbi:hypothetical protein ZHAS_00000145 [Anopheles sinensis]|uniref:Uncharacterized protein n=1 Tax=Anopheles sinensis TaxID=74873 RepID=A0A084V9X2_ANOSI|nr:hypothetical protein ZHAS_00000145 [Anopheles sinensis]
MVGSKQMREGQQYTSSWNCTITTNPESRANGRRESKKRQPAEMMLDVNA